MGHSDSKLPTPKLSSQAATRGLPPVLRVAYKKSSLSELVLLLSEPDSEPTYCLSVPAGWWGALRLHDGNSPNGTPLVHAKPNGKWKKDYAITLPSFPGYNNTSGAEILRYVMKRRERYWFGLQVGQGAQQHIERFEWRRSHGSEVKAVGGWSYGWKLVRLKEGTPEDAQSGGEEPDRANGFTSDGREVVAVWADTSSIKSMSRVGEFQLLGSGRSGELGMNWQLMAMMSCMCIWQREMQTSTMAAAS